MKLKRIFKWSALALLVVGFFWFQFAYWTSTNDCNVAVQGEPMKAIKVCEYGVVQLVDASKPAPSDNQVLVRVAAASLNPADGHTIRGSAIGRVFGGLRKPRKTSFGIDVRGNC